MNKKNLKKYFNVILENLTQKKTWKWKFFNGQWEHNFRIKSIKSFNL